MSLFIFSLYFPIDRVELMLEDSRKVVFIHSLPPILSYPLSPWVLNQCYMPQSTIISDIWWLYVSSLIQDYNLRQKNCQEFSIFADVQFQNRTGVNSSWCTDRGSSSSFQPKKLSVYPAFQSQVKTFQIGWPWPVWIWWPDREIVWALP